MLDTQGSGVGGGWTHEDWGVGVEHTRIRVVLETQGLGVGGGHARMVCVCWTHKDQGVLDTRIGGVLDTRIREGGCVVDTQGSGVGGCWTHKDWVLAVLDTQGSGGCWTKGLGGVGHKDRGGWVCGGHTRIRGGWVLDTQGSGVGGVGHTRIGGGGVLDTQGLGGGCWTHKSLLSQVGQDWYSRVLYCGFVGHARIRGTGCWDTRGSGGGGGLDTQGLGGEVLDTRIRGGGGGHARIRGGGGGHTRVGEGGVGQARIKVGGGVWTHKDIRGCWTHKVWGVFDTQGLGGVGHTRIGGCWTKGLGVAQRLQVGVGGGMVAKLICGSI